MNSCPLPGCSTAPPSPADTPSCPAVTWFKTKVKIDSSHCVTESWSVSCSNNSESQFNNEHLRSCDQTDKKKRDCWLLITRKLIVWWNQKTKYWILILTPSYHHSFHHLNDSFNISFWTLFCQIISKLNIKPCSPVHLVVMNNMNNIEEWIHKLCS